MTVYQINIGFGIKYEFCISVEKFKTIPDQKLRRLISIINC
jgi:hypothetical protein